MAANAMFSGAGQMGFFAELRRRNVFRVGIAYAVTSWLLLQLTEVLYELLELPAWAPRIVILLLVIGFVPALLFAWAFEMTPEGLKREREIDRSQSVTRDTGRKLDRAIIVVLALALAYFATDKFLLERAPARPEPVAASAETTAALAAPELAAADAGDEIDRKSIAVLPFANRSPNPDDAFFADGIHDDLLTHLSKLADLHVISRTSVMGYAGTSKKISDIGAELGVATVLEGAVQRAGDRVRINVQLIDAESDNHLWAEIYDRELTADTIFDIQSEITKAIAAALDAVLSAADEAVLQERPTQNLAAYDAYLQGRLQAGRYFVGENELLEGVAQFDKAIALDPQFGEAYASKAYAQIALYWYSSVAGDWLGEAERSLMQAEALAPGAVETLAARGYFHYWGQLDYVRADLAFDRALEQSPNFLEAIAGKAFVARRDGRFEEALTLLEMGRRLDPLNVDFHSSIAETLVGLGRFDEALEAVERARASGRDLAVDPTISGLVWEGQGDAERAWRAVADAEGVDSTNLYQYRSYYALRTRDPANIRQSLENWPEAQRRPGHAPETYELARARAQRVLGNEEAAQAILREIRQRVEASADPYPDGWKANAFYHPVDLPGLLGDLDGVRAALADFEANYRPDAWAEERFRRSFAAALINAGDPDGAFDQLDRLVRARGPWVFPMLSIDPAFDPVREDPRYLALQADYRAWAKKGAEGVNSHKRAN